MERGGCHHPHVVIRKFYDGQDVLAAWNEKTGV